MFINIDKYRILKTIFFVFISIGFTSCAQAEPIPPQSYHDLIVKAKEIIVMCSMLLQHSKAYHGQVISRLYYSYYHIARLISNNITGYDLGGHHLNWKSLPNDIKTKANTIKKLRIKHDYDPDSSSNDIIDDFKLIIDNQDLLDLELNELESTLPSNMNYSEYKDEIIDLKNEHKKLIKKIEDIINKS